MENRRMTDHHAYQPRILSDEEIEMYLDGDRRAIDRLILFSINRITSVLIPHAEKEDKREKEWDAAIEDLGGIKSIIKRAEFVDAMIKKTNDEALLMREARNKILMWGLGGFLLAVSVVFVFVWNGNVPQSLHLPMPTGVKK